MNSGTAYADENQALEEPYLWELRRLSVLAAAFLTMAGGDAEKAVNVLDETINLLLDGGVLSMWRYRLLLAAIREEAAQ